jgi:transcriptional regulator with XRE-family HTH domain
MKVKELLLECKVKKGVASDYELADVLKIDRSYIHYYMNGKRQPDEYACFRIAEALGRDPAHVIAEIKAETSKHNKKYFQDFRLRHGLRVLVAASLLNCSISYAPETAAAQIQSNSHNVYYVK